MSDGECESPEVKAVEAIMLEKFIAEPFHNLRLILPGSEEPNLTGGTCSEKTLSFVSAAKKAGFDVALHSGFIGGREIHRLARVNLHGRRYFADVGNGWPSIRLYPADRGIHYRCFGMRFRTEVSNSRVSVFHEKQGKESLQLEIEKQSRSEDEIKADIAARFNSGLVYPFMNSLRLAFVVGSKFIFLRGNRLEIFTAGGCEFIDGPEKIRGSQILSRRFGSEVESLICDSL